LILLMLDAYINNIEMIYFFVYIYKMIFTKYSFN
jgi:hypothetical protein